MPRYIVKTAVMFENVDFIEADSISIEEAREYAISGESTNFLQKHVSTHVVQVDEVPSSETIAECVERYKQNGYF